MADDEPGGLSSAGLPGFRSFWSDGSSGRADYFAEARDDFLGDGARFASSEDALIEFGGGDDFGGGAGEKAFVAGIDIVAGQVAFGERNAQLSGNVDDRGAGDAGQGAGGDRRGGDETVADDEDVVAGAFGYQSQVIEDQSFFGASLECLDLGHDIVQVIQAFDLRTEDVV